MIHKPIHEREGERVKKPNTNPPPMETQALATAGDSPSPSRYQRQPKPQLPLPTATDPRPYFSCTTTNPLPPPLAQPLTPSPSLSRGWVCESVSNSSFNYQFVNLLGVNLFGNFY